RREEFPGGGAFAQPVEAACRGIGGPLGRARRLLRDRSRPPALAAGRPRPRGGRGHLGRGPEHPPKRAGVAAPIRGTPSSGSPRRALTGRTAETVISVGVSKEEHRVHGWNAVGSAAAPSRDPGADARPPAE